MYFVAMATNNLSLARDCFLFLLLFFSFVLFLKLQGGNAITFYLRLEKNFFARSQNSAIL